MAFFGENLRRMLATANYPGVPPDTLPVVDKTGIAGSYDFHLIYQGPAASAESAANADDLRDAIRRQLGLRLVEAKTPQEVIVVDHLERIPTEN